MMKITKSSYYKTALILIGFVLLIIVKASNLAFDAQGKAFWADEHNGIFLSCLRLEYLTLFTKGALAQGSFSPLDYIKLKLFFDGFSNSWLQWIDLRVFFRIPTIVDWINSGLLVGIGVYFSGIKYFRWMALGATWYFLSNGFGSHYAVETRPYSGWVFFTTLQIVSYWFDINGNKLGRYGIVFSAFGLATIANVGPLQVVIAEVIYIFNQKNRPNRRWVITYLGLAFLIGIYYMLIYKPWPYLKGTTLTERVLLYANDYYLTLREITMKSLRSKNLPLYFVNILFISAGLIRNQKLKVSASYSWLGQYTICLLSLTFMLFLASLKTGLYVTARHYIFLLPTISILQIATIGFWISQIKNNKLASQACWIVLVAISGPEVYKDLSNFKNPIRLVERKLENPIQNLDDFEKYFFKFYTPPRSF